MIHFVVVSHNKALAEETIKLASIMKYSDFKIINASGLKDSSEYGTDSTIIMEAINSIEPSENVLVFCELGSSLMNTQMAIEMCGRNNVHLVNGPFVESLVVATASNNPDKKLQDILEEIKQTKEFEKTL
ncbi:dihydroxyacetone kinase phosphoryl donor subunit DhaM [Mycoplasmopsis caviae]|uniref:phosphoenolpyruvate--glycerone phosphotransferase n=1 Tax=Mycoplasmopsis caviae TaxID=55603 RepID=A0A3P8MF84_9BACT|nr:dihydroxyacetone kinase phosphoryl donor subunit DhaM [Mycoplasmopsis caviae]UUD35286.1 dihydroxyacetone kinase phosphoryl donor subunit DhaM [Mycoplasmopsis caviae]VDR41933.1 PTS system enzyme I [Mycoplasmopsis caviae]